MKVLLLCDGVHPLRDQFFEFIRKRYLVESYDPTGPVAKQFAGVDVVVDMGGSSSTRELIDSGIEAGVKLWQVATTGLDHVDVAYFLEKGMPLSHSPGESSAVPVAEHALFLILCFAKGLKSNDVRSWSRSVSEELEGKTLGLVGFGSSGCELARRASSLGLRITAIDIVDVPQAVREQFRLEFLGPPSEQDHLLTEADYISLHVPLTSRTRQLINRRALGLMKSTAVLINVARGGLIDEEALAEALQKGRIRGAGLDVFAQEPVDPSHPLLRLDNVIATPHVAGFTTSTWRRRAEAVVENIDRMCHGLEVLHRVTSVV